MLDNPGAEPLCDSQQGAVQAVKKVLPDITETPLTCLQLLGSPLHDAGISTASDSARDTIARLCRRVKSLDRHTGLFFLAHYVSAPRLTYLIRSAPLFKDQTSLQHIDELVRSTLSEVTNVDVSGAAWAQAALPLRHGGLGVRSVEMLALPCYIASLHAATQLIIEICPTMQESARPSLLLPAIEGLQNKTGSPKLPEGPDATRQKEWDDMVSVKIVAQLLEGCNQVDRARLLAATKPHTAAWLQAIPVPSLGLHLGADTVRIAVALRLGSPVCEPHPCRLCHRQVEQQGHHGLSCIKSAGRLPRHGNPNDVVKRSLTSAGLPSILEPLGLDRGDGKRPDGLTLFPFKRGKALAWDATCVDTFASSSLIKSAIEPGSASKSAELRKCAKYEAIADRYIFVPVAVETTGVLGPSTTRFLAEVGTRISSVTGDKRESEWLFQRLSMAIIRGNAAAVLSTAGAKDSEPRRVVKLKLNPGTGQARVSPTASDHGAGVNGGADEDCPPVLVPAADTKSAIPGPTATAAAPEPTPMSGTATQSHCFADAPSLASVAPALTGLKNLGNTCFMNAVVQCINNTPSLSEYLVSDICALTRGEVARELAEAVKMLRSGHYRSVALDDLKAAMGRHHSRFRGSAQQDAHEFLMYMLDSLYEDLNEADRKQSLKVQDNDGVPDPQAAKLAWDDFMESNRSFVLNLFWGQHKSTLRCSGCGHQSAKFETFSHLSVPMPVRSSPCSLHECLQLYMADDIISSWTCPKCESSMGATKRLDIWRLPQLLIIHVQRFYNDGVWRKREANMHVPLQNLDMTPYVIDKEAESRYHQYHLYGVVNHFGSMESGHYTAFCCGAGSTRWHKFDDEEVNPMNRNVVQSSAGYLLFYASIDHQQKKERITTWRPDRPGRTAA